MKLRLTKTFFLLPIIVLLLLITISYIYVSTSAKDKTYTSISEIPFNKTVLLLGTSKFMNNGEVNLFFTTRCDAAAELWEKGKVLNIIISGDSTSKTYDEPELMRQELLSKGLPDSIMILHKKGFNTSASIIFCKNNNINELTIVSQKFHNQRAIVISKSMGINAIGYNANPVYTTYGTRVMMREWLARVKLVFELVHL